MQTSPQYFWNQGGMNEGWQATNWMLIGLGVAVFISGSVRLRVFLKRNPLETRA